MNETKLDKVLKMASLNFAFYKLYFVLNLLLSLTHSKANDILGCGGFVKSHANLDFSKIEIGLYTKSGSLKEKTECAPTNGYYFLPLYEKGEYVLKVHPPPGWSFEPSQVELNIDGATDPCSLGQDVNFSFNGFGITGKVSTAGLSVGPSGISVQLVSEKGETRNTVTTVGGNFHFTPVVPGKYTVKAFHSSLKLDPSQTVVVVREGTTAVPTGALVVKGYPVRGSVTSYGKPISKVHVLLYSKEESPKFRVEGCTTALLHGVPDAPICYSITDTNGEFNFGLVPAGHYKLVALTKNPGQNAVMFNIQPESVTFEVKHESLYIKDAFEIKGYTVTGTVRGPASVRVLKDGAAAATTDSTGQYTLPSLQPGEYTLNFQHEQCEFDPVKLSISSSGDVRLGVASIARWRTCGTVTGGGQAVTLTSSDGRVFTADLDQHGKWCTFLARGEYSVSVQLSDQERRDGLQFYPLTQKISVSSAPIDGVTFSQLKATLSGAVSSGTDSGDVRVSLQPLNADGRHQGKPVTATTKDGKYQFKEVLPGSVEVSVLSDRLCWQSSSVKVEVNAAEVTVPTFVSAGYKVVVNTEHECEIDYVGGDDRGTFKANGGTTVQCVKYARKYTLTPRSCHVFRPDEAHVDTNNDIVQPIEFIAVKHATGVTLKTKQKVTDLILTVDKDGKAGDKVGPIHAKQNGDHYVYEHIFYLAPGEVLVVSPSSPSLVFSPSGPVQIVGGSDCVKSAVHIEGVAATVVRGKIVPPVPGAVVTLTAEDGTILTQSVDESGTYALGPIASSLQYRVMAARDSYVMTGPDQHGVIHAHRLAALKITLLDDKEQTPLQGALVSVSGGSYRRTQVCGQDGELEFSSLAPAEYYVKPLLKEYKFEPAHQIIPLADGEQHKLTLKGTRVAWSCTGWVRSLGGSGVSDVTVMARPALDHCDAQEATTDVSGQYRIRGLIPGCEYDLHLKQSEANDAANLKLVKAPPKIKVVEKKDINDIELVAIQTTQVTDVNVLIYTPNIDHYKTLKLKLALEESPLSPLYSTKVDSNGYTDILNPGVVYVMPRLPADNKSYVIHIESSLSKATHSFNHQSFYFNSDGKFKSFNVEFVPKVKSSDEELRHTSILLLPLLAALVAVYMKRDLLLAKIMALATKQNKVPDNTPKPPVLDSASIEHIVNTVNAAGKKTKRKMM